MAFLGSDSFDDYVTADGPLNGFNFNSVAAVTASVGRRSTSALRIGGSNNSVTYIPPKTPTGTTAIIAFSVKFSSLALNLARVVGIHDINGVEHLTMNITPVGAVELRRGGIAGTVLASAPAGTITTALCQLQIKVTIDDSSGAVAVRKDGNTTAILSATSVDTRNAGVAGWSYIQFQGSGSGVVYDIDDLVVYDGSGSECNDWMGDVAVSSHFPNANGATSNSTPSTGVDRYATVDEAAQNGDTDYNTITAVNDKDTLGLQDLLVVGAAILGFQVIVHATKTDAGVGSIASVIRHSGTDYVHGTPVALPASTYAAAHFMYEQNPGTSAQATETDFNAFQVGYKRTA